MRLSVKSLKCKQSHETEDHVIMLAFSNKDKNLQPWIPVHEFPTIIIVVGSPCICNTQHVQTTEASVVEEPNTPKVPPTEELNAATQLVTKHSKAQSNSGPRRPRKPPNVDERLRRGCAALVLFFRREGIKLSEEVCRGDEILDQNFLFSLFFFSAQSFLCFLLLRSGDIGADTRSKSALVLTGHFVGRTYQLVLSSTPLMADSDVLSAVKALQDQFEAQFESQTVSFHQILQQYMSTVDSRLEEFRSQFRGSSAGLLGPPPAPPPVPEMGAGSNELATALRFMKMEIPKFNGTDPHGWVFRVEEFFDFHGTPEPLRLRIVSFHMEGPAAGWYQWMKANNLLSSWKAFLLSLKHRFGASLYEDHQGNLSKLTQTSTVAEFQSAFEDLMNKVTGISEPLLISFFITGLKSDIRRELLFSRPSTLMEAFALARAYETRSCCNGRSTGPFQTTTPAPASPPTTIGHKQTPPIAPTPALPIRRLTPTELREKREKGLCYNCDQKYSANHRCRSKFLLLLGTDDIDEAIDEDGVATEPTEDLVTGDISSLNALAAKDLTSFLVIQWLQQLGRVAHDYAALSMEFCWEGRPIILHGDLHQSSSLITFNQFQALIHSSNVHSMFALQPLATEEPSPHRTIDHKIHLIPNSKPVNVRPYRYPHFQKNEMEKLIREMLDQVTIKDKFPIPTIDELLDELGGATIFSKLDLRAGYHQIRVHNRDVYKTAFRTHEGHYEFLVMPFGLSNAPSTFQATMNQLFAAFLRKFVIVFFDDILVYSTTISEHVTHLEQVLTCLHKVAHTPHLEAPPRFPRPYWLLSAVHSRYASIAAPLTDLLRKDAFNWTPEVTVAFDALKSAMVAAPVLRLPDFNETFVIETDASNVGIGAFSWQVGHPISYFSKKLGVHAYQSFINIPQGTSRHWLEGNQQIYIRKLLGYHFRIEYKPGRANQAADALSRVHEEELEQPALIRAFMSVVLRATPP
ncbi:Retrovirus-related Pol polyprotein from transposon 297 [Vitis vinifera]|uniref:Retrovirus-related Pol polyprotein from transposon 297 n=1 Tax=Vitis vinifera TaxID=29760 RepID=A0A438KCL8_VITVI|nr:Retrovirus-related Pol polyprotein from transposon 297 [Vitis vinifera]